MRAQTFRGRLLSVAAVAGVLGGFFACSFDRAYRQDDVPPETPVCAVGGRRCDGDRLQRCELGLDRRPGWVTTEDCSTRALACGSGELGCTPCRPASTTCAGELGKRVDTCRPDGSGWDPGPLCEGEGIACRAGICDDLCSVARRRKSNIGCEYWAAHLDNARISASLNATAQQYAVVVSNPQRDVSANVTIEEDDAEVGQPANVRVVAKARVLPQNLEVFLLGPRWVDGATDVSGTGETHTALSRHAFKITSDVPIIAYQFNPLENVNVFSNDASLLKPAEAMEGRYVVVGWPQTIANSDDPKTDFRLDLRSFITIVGMRPNTGVKVRTSTPIVAGGPIAATATGDTVTFTLQPYEVMNLESGSFGADFTGTIIDADAPVVVFSGSEAADAPAWKDLASRSCCADHLEEQLDPARTAGRRFVVARSPNRARAVRNAGASAIGPFDEPDFVRIVAVAEGKIRVRTTLADPSGHSDFILQGQGTFHEIEAHQDFAIESDGAVHVSVVQASQEAAGVPRGYPGGDPSLLIMPPIEQFRSEYVFLTPDKYSFDFLTILAPRGAKQVAGAVVGEETQLLFDGAPFDADACEKAFVPPTKSPVNGADTGFGFDVWRCQLSFPIIDAIAGNVKVTPGRQNDGVHRIQASRPIGLVVYGFDSFVSYAYAAGTELETLTPR